MADNQEQRTYTLETIAKMRVPYAVRAPKVDLGIVLATLADEIIKLQNNSNHRVVHTCCVCGKPFIPGDMMVRTKKDAWSNEKVAHFECAGYQVEGEQHDSRQG
jgi:hypothetical protein